MDRKIIFLDIDGTLTLPGTNVPPDSALKAIKKAQKRGHYVFLCTGRNYDMLSPLLQYGFDGVVGSSGGYVCCGDEVIYDCPMTREQSEKAMGLLRRNGVFFTIECKDGSYTDEGFKIFLEEHAGEGGNSELLRWRQQLEESLNILPLEQYKGQPIYKIVVMADSPDKLEEPQKELIEEFGFCLQEPDRYGIINGEIVNYLFDKGKGIERVCEKYGISIMDTVAIGDSMNDKEMIEKAGQSIVMENGSEILKTMADYVCPSVENDGIYVAFTRCHLI